MSKMSEKASESLQDMIKEEIKTFTGTVFDEIYDRIDMLTREIQSRIEETLTEAEESILDKLNAEVVEDVETKEEDGDVDEG